MTDYLTITDVFPRQCNACVHVSADGEQSCDAFETIPDAIFWQMERHESVLPGQREDVTFELDQKQADENERYELMVADDEEEEEDPDA